MNNHQSFFKVRLGSPIKLGALSAPKPTRFGGNGKASRNAIVLFSKKQNLIRHIFSDFFLLNLTHATPLEIRCERVLVAKANAGATFGPGGSGLCARARYSTIYLQSTP
jgi:hypothetical protein